MSKFVEKPSLPLNVGTVLIGEKYAPMLADPLAGLGIDALVLRNNPYIDPRLSSHADMSVCHLGGNRLFCAAFLRGSESVLRLENAGAELIFSDRVQKAEYPQDAVINACAAGSTLIYSPKVTDSRLPDAFSGKRISVRQGYCSCSICVADEKSVITSDKGISGALRNEGFDVLEIAAGYIGLEGFPYGFIGGCSFLIGKNRLAFTGGLDRHPDRDRIMDFLFAKGIAPVFLTDNDAFDIGSAIPILER